MYAEEHNIKKGKATAMFFSTAFFIGVYWLAYRGKIDVGNFENAKNPILIEFVTVALFSWMLSFVVAQVIHFPFSVYFQKAENAHNRGIVEGIIQDDIYKEELKFQRKLERRKRELEVEAEHLIKVAMTQNRLNQEARNYAHQLQLDLVRAKATDSERIENIMQRLRNM